MEDDTEELTGAIDGWPSVVGVQTRATKRLGAAASKRCGGERSKKAALRLSVVCREDERKRTVQLGIENLGRCQDRRPSNLAG